MADTKISALTAATVMADADQFAINESGTSKSITGTLVKDWVGSMLRNQSTATQSVGSAATVTAYLTNSNIAVPSAKIRIGTRFEWNLAFTKTATGTQARSHLIKIGTAGSLADATVATFTTSSPTAVADQGFQMIRATVRGPLSASCTLHGVSFAGHQLSTTGLFNNATDVRSVTSGTWDATTANLIVGLAVVTGNFEVITYEQVTAEAYNL